MSPRCCSGVAGTQPPADGTAEGYKAARLPSLQPHGEGALRLPLPSRTALISHPQTALCKKVAEEVVPQWLT